MNVTTVSQALERLKLSESTENQLFLVYNAVDVGKVFTKTFEKSQK